MGGEAVRWCIWLLVVLWFSPFMAVVLPSFSKADMAQVLLLLSFRVGGSMYDRHYQKKETTRRKIFQKAFPRILLEWLP